ncbi:sulfurtransferase [Verminephrobacter aporrectodeae subsp. tuberculatae]|uniref:sulfurtransferase n=1 Tax=Verminephrobacter aporrectodeae TaxID=1110389 RepID=UPI002243CA80|nr:sulfurtransferase [Verminephrobacter aporrectodeae]MCW8164506.1 sulfurtransferase [Verminephrobacter aporrectodeae subsp. tuberculatae]MCW8168782.1 sulfurtransferase [Verminephrobacter aporrectodeae subsp. tuberculatae]
MPTYTTLICAPDLQSLAASGAPLMVFDCSFELTQPAAGAGQYAQAHIPGALYADLNANLSAGHGAPDAVCGGRHPLPGRERFALWLSGLGFSNAMQAVVYDRQGANYCARLWWMLKWLGHDAVAVLDGGLQAWQAAGGALAQGAEPARPAAHFQPAPALLRLATAADVLRQLRQPGQTVVDARSAARYRGEVEPLDPVAGHIPGALNRPFTENVAADGRFKPAAVLRAEFDTLLAGRDPATVVHQCGSGVSAVPNLLAMEVAGLGRTALFAGSWSEWCSDPARPVERG